MDKQKKARLEAQGWKVGSIEEFLGLTPEEAGSIEIEKTGQGVLTVLESQPRRGVRE